MPITYIALGSNLGNREKNIQKACDLLKGQDIQILKKSSIIETDPKGPPQGKYLNCVIKVATKHSPQILLNRLKLIERQMGRVKTIRHGPRPIDLDILLYDNIAFNSKGLTIPHPRMFERDFVLRPLKEIEPQILQSHSCAS